MNTLLCFLALFAADMEAIRLLPTEDECLSQLDFHQARLEDALTQTTQLETEAKFAVEQWMRTWQVVKETKRAEPIGNEPRIVGHVPVSILERLEALKVLKKGDYP